MIKVTINGKERDIDPPHTVLGLLVAFQLKPALVVVERNGVIVARSRFIDEPVEEGDQLEVVQMMAGG